MECNGITQAQDLNYCGETLHIGTTEAIGDLFVELENTATGRVYLLENEGTLPDIDVALPSLPPGQVFHVKLASNDDFVPYESPENIGTTSTRELYVKFTKRFDGDGFVITDAEQYLIIPQI